MASGPHITRAKEQQREARAARLAKALRANLARRKEQGRARPSDPDLAPGDAGPAEPAP